MNASIAISTSETPFWKRTLLRTDVMSVSLLLTEREEERSSSQVEAEEGVVSKSPATLRAYIMLDQPDRRVANDEVDKREEKTQSKAPTRLHIVMCLDKWNEPTQHRIRLNYL